MLSELCIENIAVIEKADVRFSAGLNVLTGETGAGKSILIDSINAILGNRTSRDLIRTGAGKAAVWASFSDLPPQILSAAAGLGCDAGEGLLLERELSADGRSVCRVNGHPATAGILRELGAQLVTIHGQHDNQSLLDPSTHLGILDEFARDEAELTAYRTEYANFRSIEKQLAALSLDEGEKRRRTDLLQYECDEIDRASLSDVREESDLIEQRDRIRNAQKISDCLNAAYAALQGTDEDRGGVDLLGEAGNQMEQIREYAGDLAKAAENLNDLYYTAQDLAETIRTQIDGLDSESAALGGIEDRIDLIHTLERKYGGSIEAVLAFREQAGRQLNDIEFADQKITALTSQFSESRRKLDQLAAAMTRVRKRAFALFADRIAESLDYLNMPGIRLALSLSQTEPGPDGRDAAEFLLSANPGEAPKPLARIASGGELSRIMLAIKSVLAEKDRIPTVIYDEIDAGVSGTAAGRIGSKLLETAHSGHQVICITHTAQIAAAAENHLLIEKSVENGRTYTSVRTLEKKERVNELARIISGDRVTELSLANAAEMLALASERGK